MSNILDYIDWRGDLTVKNAPFNEVDNLILSQFSFMDLGGIAEGENLRCSISVREAVGEFFGKHRDEQPYMPRPVMCLHTFQPMSFLSRTVRSSSKPIFSIRVSVRQ